MHTIRRHIGFIIFLMLTMNCRDRPRGFGGLPVIEEIIVPIGFHGWVEIVEDCPSCPTAQVVGRQVSIAANYRGVACIAEELPALTWFKRIYRFADGAAVPLDMVKWEAGTTASTYANWIKRSLWICIGSNEECQVKFQPERLPPGLGWTESGREVRRSISFEDSKGRPIDPNDAN
jgi:hypothetical protein